MTEINRTDLFGKLNTLLYRSLEGATSFCKLRSNPYVELIHWIHQILHEHDSDFQKIIAHFDMKINSLEQGIVLALDELPRGASSISDLSEHIDYATERAWVYGSLKYGDASIRSAYLLLGILKTNTLRNVLYGMSSEFKKIIPDVLSEQLLDIVAGSVEEHDKQSLAQTTPTASKSTTGKSALAQYAIDMTARARNNEIDPVSGRDEEIRQMIDILMRRRQNNPLLTGEAGVGKTAVVEGLALRLAQGDVPEALRNISLYLLDIGLLQAGASMKGEFESRLRSVIDEVQASEKPIVLFIDEIHTLVGAGGQAGTGDAANLLKPALARGLLRTIGATTWAEYKKYIEKDPALTRRFQVVQVHEPDEDKALIMLRGIVAPLEKHHKVLILDEAFTYYDANAHVAKDAEYISTWQVSAEIASGAYATSDYDFRKSRAVMDAYDSLGTEATAGSNEVFEWMGGYVDPNDGEYYSLVRQEELRVDRDIIHAQSNIRAVKPGRVFVLQNHPRRQENAMYLCISAQYDIQVAGYSTGTDRQDHFRVSFTALPIATQYRKKRDTPKPKTYGPQTAKVVGPAGEEIWTDQYARVKVQFHWDRYGKSDENSSCWIRVSSPWAGSGFGGLQIPRINDEVVVDFIGGNPDRPIIIGRVHNDANMPLVELPAQAHTSGFRSKSVHGDTHQENHFLMIDELGKELVDLRAQYNMLVNVLNDLTVKVGNNLSTTIEGDEIRSVTRTRTTTVTGHETETFKSGVTRRITSAGLDDDIQGGVKRNVVGGNTYTLEGDNNETINGKETYKITEDGTYTILGKRETTVTQAVKDTFNDTWTQKVEQAVNQTFEKTWTQKVTGAVKQIFENSWSQDVTGAVKQIYKGGHDETVTGGSWKVTQDEKNSIEMSEGSLINIKADSQIVLEAPEIKITDKKTHSQGSHKTEIYALVAGYRLLDIKTGHYEKKLVQTTDTLYMTKSDIGAVKIDIKVMEHKNEATKFEWGSLGVTGKAIMLIL